MNTTHFPVGPCGRIKIQLDRIKQVFIATI
jgi:hypothetical protein